MVLLCARELAGVLLVFVGVCLGFLWVGSVGDMVFVCVCVCVGVCVCVWVRVGVRACRLMSGLGLR